MAVVGAGFAELAEGDGVAAGFGKEVAAVAEHVRPLPEPGVTGLALAAELPGGGDHPPVVRGAAQVLDVDQVSQPLIGQAGDGQGLGGVLSDVVGHRLAIKRLASARDRVAMDRPGVGLRAEPEQDSSARAEIGGDADGGGGLADGVAQQAGGVPGGRGPVVLGRGVQPDHGVEVDDAARLVLGHLDIPDAELSTQLLAGDPGQPGQVPGQVGGEPAPQVPCVGIEQHGGLIVVAVAAHRLTEPGVIFDVAGRAGDIPAVRAAARMGVATGTARQDRLAAHPPGVDRPERRRGERREHARMRGNGLGNTLAARQASPDELPGVALVHRRAGRADGLAAVAAGDVQHSPVLSGGVVDGRRLTGGEVDGVDAAAQPDRVRTVQGAASELAHFGRFLARHDPGLASLALLDRQHHIEPYLTEVAVAVNHRTGQPIAASTAKARIQSVGSFLDAIAEWGWPEAPARRLVFPRDAPKLPHPLPRYLPPDQERALLAALEASPHRLRADALLLLRATGMRIGELTDLELDCVHEVPGSGAWLKIPLGKLLTERMVPIDEETVDLVDRIVTHRSAGRPLRHPRTGKLADFLLTHQGRRISADTLREELRRAAAEAGLDGVVPHQLRHTYATALS